MSEQAWHFVGVGALLCLLGVSGLHPYDRTTWWLEIAPILIALPILVATYRSFPFTNLVYALIFVHAVILMVGGRYTYARVPLGFWLARLVHSARNPYDKVGHFAQGFVPALVTREVLIRGRYVRTPGMLSFLVVCVVLAVSAAYELVEWFTAILLGQGADEFLGTQGDPWDTQSDMLFALVGGIVSLLLLSKAHDHQVAQRQAQRLHHA